MVIHTVTVIIGSVLSVLWLPTGGSTVLTASGQVQMTNVKILERAVDDGQCPSMEERERAINDIHRIAVHSATYRFTCNGTPGWRRVAFINMTDTSYNCPTGLNLTSYSKRTCGRSHTERRGCSSTTFSVGGITYSRVCGRIRGYQFGLTSAFFFSGRGINSYYVDGISLTHGDADGRQHIWTFASGLSEVVETFPRESCPCDTSQHGTVPAFVGNDYFCESGFHSEWNFNSMLYPNDVLWDGQDCTANSTCCQLNNPPWFTKNLPTATTDNIELRICTSNPPSTDDVPIELIELYIQ